MAEPIVIPKNDREEIRVSRDLFKGKDLLSIRVWYEAEDGEYRPSRKGISIRIEMVGDLVHAITAAVKAGMKQ